MKGGIIVLIVVCFIALGIFVVFFPYFTADIATITVTDKERIVSRGGGSSSYLVFTENEVFENADCFVRFKFSSSDLQSKLRRGQTYTVVVYGWRIPFLSWYRNIVKIK